MNNDHLPYDRSIAYCKGFVHGFDKGVSKNPYDGEHQAINHNLYKIGYDAGVTEYCREEHPEDENQ
jgi:hypothetical protein